MPNESDIEVYDPKDWRLLVDGVVIESPLKFEIKPTFADDDKLIESLYGEVGFEEHRSSTKGEGNVVTTFNSASRAYLDSLAKDRKKVPVEAVCVQNQARYKKTRFKLLWTRIKPAGVSVDKQAQGPQYDLFGFGYSDE